MMEKTEDIEEDDGVYSEDNEHLPPRVIAFRKKYAEMLKWESEENGKEAPSSRVSQGSSSGAIKVKAWRAGGKRGSLVVVIPFQIAKLLELGDEPTLHCTLDFETRSIVYRKAD